MKFLVDAQLPPALCARLGGHGREALHVTQIGMDAASEAAIASYAETNGQTLVSKDEDFVVRRLPDRFGLLWLRCGNATNRALVAWPAPRWPQISMLLDRGERLSR